MDHDFLVLWILVSSQIGVGASVGFLVLWVLVSWMGMVALQYTMCCVQSVLGFGKSDRWGGACGR